MRACVRACVCCPGGPQEVWNQGELEGVDLQALQTTRGRNTHQVQRACQHCKRVMSSHGLRNHTTFRSANLTIPIGVNNMMKLNLSR